MSRRQLLDAGLTPPAIRHRVERGRLHPWAAGIYAVGRPDLTRHGQMVVAVLGCGPGAAVSHETAAELWRVRRRVAGPIEISVPTMSAHRRPGVTLHRRQLLETATCERISVTTVPLTLIDMALRWSRAHLEAAINQADALDLLDPGALRKAMDGLSGRPGVKIVRDLLDEATFLLTDSELERLFLRLVRRAGLAEPRTRRYVSGHRVDFVWDELGLVVETDGLRYHRTPLQQRRDLERDQAHRARGMVPVRFTHYQVRWQPEHVLRGLADGARMAEAARELRQSG